jgi:hypothetical protein
VRKIVDEFRPRTYYPASDSLLQILQTINLWFGSSTFLIAVRRC